MTKAASILIAPMIALRTLPEQDRAVIRRFLFDLIRGLDAKNDKRWRRLWSRIWKAEPGEGFQIYSMEERSGAFHRRHRAILDRLFESQERFRNIKALHDWMKVGAYWVTWEEGKTGKPIPKPRSTSFPECSEDEMREAHMAMLDYLHTERAQRYLWKHLKSEQRQDMLETIIQGPEQEGEQ